MLYVTYVLTELRTGEEASSKWWASWSGNRMDVLGYSSFHSWMVSNLREEDQRERQLSTTEISSLSKKGTHSLLEFNQQSHGHS